MPSLCSFLMSCYFLAYSVNALRSCRHYEFIDRKKALIKSITMFLVIHKYLTLLILGT